MIAPKTLAPLAFHHGGPLAGIRWLNRNNLRILMYHRFPADAVANFQGQCEHLTRNYHPITLTEAGEYLKRGMTFPSNSVVVTVDDGYRDFHPNAFPALKKFGIPATVFLTTGVTDGATWFWWDKMRFAIERTKIASISLAGERDVPLRDAREKEAGVHRIMEALTRVPNRDRARILDRLPSIFEVEVPAVAPPEFAPLSWDQIREMSRNGMDFGAHTVNHPILSRVETPEELRQEMEVSRDRIAEQLSQPTRHFCYPSGRAEDVDGRARQLAESAGFETAVTTASGLNNRRSDRLMLRRVGVEPFLDIYTFARRLAGHRLTV